MVHRLACGAIGVLLGVGCAQQQPKIDLVEVVPVEEREPPPKPADEAPRESVRAWRDDGTLAMLPEELRTHIRWLADDSAVTVARLQARQPDVLQKPATGYDPALNLLLFERDDVPRSLRNIDCMAGHDDALVTCARLIHNKNARELEQLDRDFRFVEALAPYSRERSVLESAVRGGLDAVRRSAAVAGSRSSQYGFYAGPNYSLGGNGQWKEGVEVLARFNTQAFRPRYLAWSLPERAWYRGYSEISYQTVNALEDVPEATGGSSDPLGTPALLEELDNPFLDDGGYLRMNFGGQLHFNDWIGVQGGFGYSSRPNTDDVTNMEPRGFLGLHFETLYGDGSYGSVFAGYAYDRFWEREVYNDPDDPSQGRHIETDFHRLNIDTYFIFSPEVLGTRAVARMFVDTPLTGDGPSDVRVSVLLYYSLSDWLGAFRPVQGVVSRLSAITSAASGSLP